MLSLSASRMFWKQDYREEDTMKGEASVRNRTVILRKERSAQPHGESRKIPLRGMAVRIFLLLAA